MFVYVYRTLLVLGLTINTHLRLCHNGTILLLWSTKPKHKHKPQTQNTKSQCKWKMRNKCGYLVFCILVFVFGSVYLLLSNLKKKKCLTLTSTKQAAKHQTSNIKTWHTKHTASLCCLVLHKHKHAAWAFSPLSYRSAKSTRLVWQRQQRRPAGHTCTRTPGYPGWARGWQM